MTVEANQFHQLLRTIKSTERYVVLTYDRDQDVSNGIKSIAT